MLYLPDYRTTASGAFDVENDITWHSLWWAEGTNFVAESYADGADVSPWPNEVSGELDLSQGTASQRPHYRATVTALNNRPAVEFDKADTHRLDNSSTMTTAPGGTISFVSVVKPDVDADGIFCGAADGGGSSPCGYVGIDTPQWTAGNGFFPDAGTSDTNGHLFTVVTHNSTAADQFYVDGTKLLDQDMFTRQADRYPRIGALTNGTQQSDCTVALFAIYDGDITADGSYSDFKTWVDDHYGITVA